MDGMRLRPLASSLDPLPGESLTGFLLRTACRLDRSPARVAEITGLLPPGRTAYLSFNLLMDPDPAQRASFAAVTRLSEDEAAALCLSWYADRYPPARPAPGPGGPRGWKGARSSANRWICDRLVR